MQHSKLYNKETKFVFLYLEQRVSFLHREADVLIQECAAVAEDMEEYRMLVQSLVGDDLQQPLAEVRHLVPAPKQTFHRRRVTQRNATAKMRRSITVYPGNVSLRCLTTRQFDRKENAKITSPRLDALLHLSIPFFRKSYSAISRYHMYIYIRILGILSG